MPKQLRMAHKLWLAVILIVVMLVAVVGFAAYRSAKVQAQADAVSKEMEARVQAALRWSGLTETNAARTQALIVSNDPAVEAEFKDVIAATSAQISEVQKSLESMALSDADKAQMNKIAAARRFFNSATAEYNTAIQQFPANLIAGPFGFQEEIFFELDAAEAEMVKKPVAVNFGS